MAPGIATSPGQDWAKGGGWGGIASGEVLVLDRRGVVLEVLAPYVKPVASSVVATRGALRKLELVEGGLSPAQVATLHTPLSLSISDTAGSRDEAADPTIIAIMANAALATVQWRPQWRLQRRPRCPRGWGAMPTVQLHGSDEGECWEAGDVLVGVPW